ncbi:hypothetical protein D9615_004790 [Tricholomella constricta]|uniref:Uncharacterized protein n=1 Tax=Tricholomella constricta TaxID=117010 RepID=A0A8H5M715_9AGAR|nr:hypothetical protein D9615_004790 [Tricholomella constricta]
MATVNAPEHTDEKEALTLSESDLGTESDLESDTESETNEPKARDTTVTSPPSDPRFHQAAPPSPFKRTALIVLTLLLFWLALSTRKSLWPGKKSPKVIYASRYSKEHKFRPAASPIITETLKDGRIRIRGAGPTATPEPTPILITKKGKRRAKARFRAKKNVKKPSRRK